uniref:non-specific serine/threonine protein kinase n=1 Tax=Gouania willdenowi TaxID=441366 RepID=A0A8C5GYG5_GOUWI
METVGKYEFSRKDLIGHGAFAVVFKGRHREKNDWEVAVKCINKKNLAKSQTLLGKEIRILKYCNGGDLADYLHSKGTLSEDTIRLFLQQITGAMRVLQSKGIIHRDLKPQNILLSYPPGRKSHSNNTCIKIADFGFARYLQNNMMAATLCGSPMYMAPEVIMSQNYDAKADLWSIGTIVFQCLTGKAPFQVNTQQIYTQLLIKIPYVPLVLFVLAASPVPTVTTTCLPSSASASSCSSSSTSHLASPPSLAEIQHLRAKPLPSPTQEATAFLLKDSSGGAGSSSKNSSSCDTDDFVMVPAQFPSKKQCYIRLCLSRHTNCSLALCILLTIVRPAEYSGCNHGNQSMPIPVPTQVRNYQRIEQKLHSTKQDDSLSTPVRRCSSGSLLGYVRTGPSPPYPQGTVTAPRRLSLGGARPFQLSPQGASQATLTLTSFHFTAAQHAEPRQPPHATGLGTRLHSAPCLLECATGGGRQKIRKQHSDPVAIPSAGLIAVRPLHSSPRLSDLVQRSPLPTILGSPSRAIPPFEFQKPPSSSNLMTFLTQQGYTMGSPGSRTAPAELRDIVQQAPAPVSQPVHCMHRRNMEPVGFGRSQSAGRLSDMLLMAAFGPSGFAGDRGSVENLNSMDVTGPLSGGGGFAPGSGSPAQVVFTVGSPPSGGTPPQSSRYRKYSGSPSSVSPAGSLTSRYAHAGIYLDGYEMSSSPRYSLNDPITANMGGAVTFEVPELPEETLMEQEHTDTVQNLRFTLDFVCCLMEVAGARGVMMAGNNRELPHGSLPLQQSLVADQISSLSREWSHAEQLVLYLKTAELLSAAIHTAMDRVKQGKLYPSATVKQVLKRLNELYKTSVASCRSLSTRLECFFTRKHRLMDQITSIKAERLLFSHTVQMVQAAALDEMFHQGEASILRYHKALLLMEGLSLLLTEHSDILSVNKCECSC